MARNSIGILLAASVVLFLPPTVVAQDAPRAMYELPTITVSVLSEADPLYETASGLYQAGDWNAAAELYRTAAEGMPHNDANSYISYDMSARLYFYAGQFTESREMMERAAEVAEATGDENSAAYRHVDAAFIAVWEGFPGKRREHIAAADAHAGSGDLDEEDVAKIGALIRGVDVLPMDEDR